MSAPRAVRCSLPVLGERAETASTQLVDCAGCTKCCEHGGLVYVRPDEVNELKRLDVPLVAIDGINFIKRQPDGACPMLDRAQKRCSIYSSRPLCCRLFPLDVISLHGQLRWAVSKLCPDERRTFSDSHVTDRRLGPASVGMIAEALTESFAKEDGPFFEEKERVASEVDVLDDDAHQWIALGRFDGRSSKR